MYMLSSICVHLMKMESICFDFFEKWKFLFTFNEGFFTLQNPR